MSLEFIKVDNEEKYLIKKENVYFSVNRIMYFILKQHQKNKNSSEISEYLNLKEKTFAYDSDFVETILNNEKTKKILSSNEEDATKSKTTYIFFKRKLLKPEKIQFLLKPISKFLFLPNVLLFFSFFGILSTICYLYFNYEELILLQNSYNSNVLNEIPTVAVVYISFILIIFIHELGHAAGAYKHGIVPEQIGFGFYYTMPILYTELTEIWKLRKSEKIIVNIAGIYFQLIINVLLVIFAIIFSNYDIFKILVIINTFSLFFALNPFFKNDGYWVFSDYFDIPNLEKKADKCFINLCRFFYTPKKSFDFLKDKATILVIYSCINTLFWFYFLYKTSYYMLENAKINYNILLHGINIFEFFNTIVYLLFVFMFFKSIISRVKSIANYHE